VEGDPAQIPDGGPRPGRYTGSADHPEWLYIVKEGKVKLVKHSDSGKDVILQIFAPGDMFGEFALFDRKPYPTSLRRWSLPRS
jgi:CRP/FNR family transcriptional regulator